MSIRASKAKEYPFGDFTILPIGKTIKIRGIIPHPYKIKIGSFHIIKSNVDTILDIPKQSERKKSQEIE